MKKFKATLNKNSLNKLVRQLEEYRDGLDGKMATFIEKLLDVGIKVARFQSIDVPGQFGTHQMGRYVTFEKEIEVGNNTCRGLMLGIGETLFSTWYAREERHGSINAIMALEFGTAALALSVREAFGAVGGQGTNSKYGHENDMEWFLYKENGGHVERIKATAIRPTRPMYNAALEMSRQIVETAREVFGG